MTYNPLIPQPNDLLDDSQVDILTNFNTSNISFGIDHYAFDDLTVNNGKHKKVSTPTQGSHQATTTDPILYANQDTASIGVIQYSRGPTNAVPSPVTRLHSTAAGLTMANGATIPVLNFSGLSIAFATLWVFGVGSGRFTRADISYQNTGTRFIIIQTPNSSPSFVVGTSGDTLQITNNGSTVNNGVYWTLQLDRVQV